MEYVSRNEVTPHKIFFDKMISKIRKDIRKQGMTFTYQLVGSAKRNLVIKHHNQGFDLDYQVIVQKNGNKLSPSEIKELFIRLFDKVASGKFHPCEDSTSAITIKKVNSKESKIEVSYDVVILTEIHGQTEIIRRTPSGDYVWNKTLDLSEFQRQYSKISGSEMWQELRQRYYHKKIRNLNMAENERKKSYQLLHEAVNETLKHFE